MKIIPKTFYPYGFYTSLVDFSHLLFIYNGVSRCNRNYPSPPVYVFLVISSFGTKDHIGYELSVTYLFYLRHSGVAFGSAAFGSPAV